MNVNGTLRLQGFRFITVLLNQWKHLLLITTHQLHQLLRSCCFIALISTLILHMRVLNHPFQVLKFLGTLVRPHFKLLIEKTLVLALNNQRVGFIILLDDETRLRLQSLQEELIKSLKI